MKKLFLMVLFLAFTTPVLADKAQIEGWSELSDAQKAEIALVVAQKAEQKKSSPVKPEDIAKWVEVGKSIGVGFSSTAKELGMGVDELMKTDTGKIAMFLIVWNYIGDQLVGIIGGSIWFLIMLPAWAIYFRRFVLNPVRVYHDNGKLAKSYYEPDASEAKIAYFSVALVIILGGGFILIF